MALDGTLLGHYRLLRLLGSSLTSEVYLAQDTLINRQVAIKVVRSRTSTSDEEVAHLFHREARAIAALDHPHILPLFEFGEETVLNTPLIYMVMPFRQEGSLANWLQEHYHDKSLPPPMVAHFIQQAADALQHVHDHHIIHQDIKPSNFLIRIRKEQRTYPDLLLADFGLAKLTGTSTLGSQHIRGTPAYMAPEQWYGHPVPATDQYALAIMAYQLLVGHLPFQEQQEQLMYQMHQHLRAQPLPPSHLNPQLPRQLDEVILHALAKDPEQRFASIAAFARAFQQAMGNTTTPTKSVQSRELRTMLAISEDEAFTGTKRTLTLPGGRHKTITVPAGIQNGQVIRVEGQDQSFGDKTESTLIITITVMRTEKIAISPVLTDKEKTRISHSDRPDKSYEDEEKTLLSHPSRPGRDTTIDTLSQPINEKITNLGGLLKRRTTLLLVMLLIILLGSSGVFYFRSFNYLQRITLLQAVSPDPYPPGGGTLVLNDPLRDNSNGYFWTEGAKDDGTRCAFEDGAYHSSASQPQHFSPCLASGKYDSFAYEVRMTIAQGDQGGIIFRANGTSYYYFHINGHGLYSLDVIEDGVNMQTLKTGFSPAINTLPNQSNLLAVVANGSQIDLYVNHQKIDMLDDNTYSGGQVGVVAENDGQPTEVIFRDAKVWRF